MSDETGRRKFMEIVAGMFTVSIIASLFSNGGDKPGGGPVPPSRNKLLDSAVIVAGAFGLKYFATTVKIGKEFINLFSPTAASADELPENNAMPIISNEQMVSLEDEMKQVVRYYDQKQYQEAIDYLKNSRSIVEYTQKDTNFQQLVETIDFILQEFLWIENLKNNKSVDFFSSCDDNLSSMQKIMNLNRIYLLEWYEENHETESVNKLEIFKQCYQNLQNAELTDKEKLLKMLAVVYATILFNYDFENNTELSTYDEAIIKAKMEFNNVELIEEFKTDSIITDQWNYFQCRLDVFDRTTSDRETVKEAIRNLPFTVLDDGERNYLLAVNALLADNLDEAEQYGDSIGIPIERSIIKLFVLYERAKQGDDRSPETRQKMKEAEALIEQNDVKIFNKLVANNQEIFDFINEEPSMIQNKFPEEEQKSEWSFF